MPTINIHITTNEMNCIEFSVLFCSLSFCRSLNILVGFKLNAYEVFLFKKKKTETETEWIKLKV